MQRFVTAENKKWWTLAAVSVGLFMIMLDNTVVNVALPSIRASLAHGDRGLEWVVAGYALTFAAFMLIGGKLADFLGRRLIFMIGLAVFTAASLACGLAPNGNFLIGARVVQGLGGALMNPATLSIITATFEPRERGKAIGIWAGVSAMALAIGPLVGGLLTRARELELDLLHQRADRRARPLRGPRLHRGDAGHSRPSSGSTCPGLATSAIGLFSLTFAFIEANKYGWGSCADPRRVRRRGGLRSSRSCCSSGISARRCSTCRCSATARSAARTPRCSSSASRCSGRSSTSRSTCRTCSHYSPVEAGASFLPMTILIILIAPRAGALTDRVGSRWLVGGGMTLLALMLLYYSQLGADESFWALLPGLLLGGVGMGDDDDADDGRGDERGGGRQGRRRLGGAELRPARSAARSGSR